MNAPPTFPPPPPDFDPNGPEPPPLPPEDPPKWKSMLTSLGAALTSVPPSPPSIEPPCPSPSPLIPISLSAPVPTASLRPSTAKLKTTLDMVASHWTQPLKGLHTAPPVFYEAVLQALEARKIPDIAVSRVWWGEGALVSAKREYLRIERRRMVYDICCAPFGAGSFISSWLCIVPFNVSLFHLLGIFVVMIPTMIIPPVGLFALLCLVVTTPVWWLFSRQITTTSMRDDFLLGLTAAGPFLRFVSERKPTYYQIDSAGVFQSAVQEAVMAVIDQMCTAQHVRSLDELQRQPIQREFMKR